MKQKTDSLPFQNALPHMFVLIGMVMLAWFPSWFFLAGIFVLMWILFPATFLLTLLLLRDVFKRKVSLLFLYFLSWYLVFCSFFLIGRLVIPIREAHYQYTSAEYNQKIGDQSVTAINKYHSEKGQLPQTLDQLVPEYMDALPRTKDGSMIRYLPFELSSGIFELRYSTPGLGMCYSQYQNENTWEKCEIGL